mmetsp:Transcript_54920/g.178459  ORF Transcript_54920/g.178459 Transcript_54920/m.178459 type:complete len:1227 (+) Transcript_54920:74-3754(+)
MEAAPSSSAPAASSSAPPATAAEEAPVAAAVPAKAHLEIASTTASSDDEHGPSKSGDMSSAFKFSTDAAEFVPITPSTATSSTSGGGAGAAEAAAGETPKASSFMFNVGANEFKPIIPITQTNSSTWGGAVSPTAEAAGGGGSGGSQGQTPSGGACRQHMSMLSPMQGMGVYPVMAIQMPGGARYVSGVNQMAMGSPMQLTPVGFNLNGYLPDSPSRQPNSDFRGKGGQKGGGGERGRRRDQWEKGQWEKGQGRGYGQYQQGPRAMSGDASSAQQQQQQQQCTIAVASCVVPNFRIGGSLPSSAAPEVRRGVRIIWEASFEDSLPGDRVLVVGSATELGNWSLPRALALQTNLSSFPVWRGACSIDADPGSSPVDFEWKLVVSRRGGGAEWEPGANRHFVLVTDSTPSRCEEWLVRTFFGGIPEAPAFLRAFDGSAPSRHVTPRDEVKAEARRVRCLQNHCPPRFMACGEADDMWALATKLAELAARDDQQPLEDVGRAARICLYSVACRRQSVLQQHAATALGAAVLRSLYASVCQRQFERLATWTDVGQTESRDIYTSACSLWVAQQPGAELTLLREVRRSPYSSASRQPLGVGAAVAAVGHAVRLGVYTSAHNRLNSIQLHDSKCLGRLLRRCLYSSVGFRLVAQRGAESAIVHAVRCGLYASSAVLAHVEEPSFEVELKQACEVERFSCRELGNEEEDFRSCCELESRVVSDAEGLSCHELQSEEDFCSCRDLESRAVSDMEGDDDSQEDVLERIQGWECYARKHVQEIHETWQEVHAAWMRQAEIPECTPVTSQALRRESKSGREMFECTPVTSKASLCEAKIGVQALEATPATSKALRCESNSAGELPEYTLATSKADLCEAYMGARALEAAPVKSKVFRSEPKDPGGASESTPASSEARLREVQVGVHAFAATPVVSKPSRRCPGSHVQHLVRHFDDTVLAQAPAPPPPPVPPPPRRLSSGGGGGPAPATTTTTTASPPCAGGGARLPPPPRRLELPMASVRAYTAREGHALEDVTCKPPKEVQPPLDLIAMVASPSRHRRRPVLQTSSSDVAVGAVDAAAAAADVAVDACVAPAVAKADRAAVPEVGTKGGMPTDTVLKQDPIAMVASPLRRRRRPVSQAASMDAAFGTVGGGAASVGCAASPTVDLVRRASLLERLAEVRSLQAEKAGTMQELEVLQGRLKDFSATLALHLSGRLPMSAYATLCLEDASFRSAAMAF